MLNVVFCAWVSFFWKITKKDCCYCINSFIILLSVTIPKNVKCLPTKLFSCIGKRPNKYMTERKHRTPTKYLFGKRAFQVSQTINKLFRQFWTEAYLDGTFFKRARNSNWTSTCDSLQLQFLHVKVTGDPLCITVWKIRSTSSIMYKKWCRQHDWAGVHKEFLVKDKAQNSITLIEGLILTPSFWCTMWCRLN